MNRTGELARLISVIKVLEEARAILLFEREAEFYKNGGIHIYQPDSDNYFELCIRPQSWHDRMEPLVRRLTSLTEPNQPH